MVLICYKYSSGGTVHVLPSLIRTQGDRGCNPEELRDNPEKALRKRIWRIFVPEGPHDGSLA